MGSAIYRLGLPTQTIPNLDGDREIEWSWVAAHIGPGPGSALDFGCGPRGFLSLIAAQRGYQVTAVDLQPAGWPHRHPAVECVQGDLLRLGLAAGRFDLVLNCSTIEHVGLAGRYGSATRPEGDLEAMALLQTSLKEGGSMIMTIPVGRDAVFAPFHRVYGNNRLPRLLEGWMLEKKEYWTKDDKNQWVRTEESRALDREGSERCYGLGLFVMRRKPGAASP
jgi:SAM-dependent methyltransferase